MGERVGLGRWKAVVGVTVAALAVVRGAHASYISNDERVEAQAELSVQGTAQHAGSTNITPVQERNEVKLGLRYFLVPVQQDLLGILHRPRISIQYRGRYDSIYDIRDVYQRRGFDRDDYRFPEGEYPRELYFDADFVHPFDWLSMRIGRQQVVWGEADLFRSLDVINPLRLDQNGLIGERFDDYREPLLIAKFLAHLGDLPGLSNASLEFFYSPNSQPLTDHAIVSEAFREGFTDNACLTSSILTVPGIVENVLAGGSIPTGLNEGSREVASNAQFQCRRPQSLPFSRTRSPWEISRVGPYRTDAPNFADLGKKPGCLDGTTAAFTGGCGDFVYGINDGWPRSWLSLNSSMAGMRLFGQTLEGLDVSFDYIFKRTEVPGTSLRVNDLFCPPGDPEGNPVFCRGDGQPNPRPSMVIAGVEALATPDLNGNGFPDGVDKQVRDCMLGKPEVIFASLHGQTPFSGAGEAVAGSGIPLGHVNEFTGCEQTGFWYPWTHIIGATATYNDNRYTGFIWRLEQSYSTREPRNGTPPLAGPRAGDFPHTDDFDRHLKRETGVWRSMIGFDYLRSITNQSRLPLFLRQVGLIRSLLTDQWFFTFQFFDEYYSHSDHEIGLLDSVTQRMHQFNPVLTYVMTGFFANDRLRPFIAAGYDVNAKFPVTWVQAEYYVTPKFSIKIGDIEYIGSSNAESFLFLNKYADRDTAFVKATYFLL